MAWRMSSFGKGTRVGMVAVRGSSGMLVALVSVKCGVLKGRGRL